MILEASIAFAIGSSALYGIVRTSLAYVERLDAREDAREDSDLSDLSSEALQTLQNRLVADHNWWSNVADVNVRVRECRHCIEAIARVKQEMIRRIGR